MVRKRFWKNLADWLPWVRDRPVRALPDTVRWCADEGQGGARTGKGHLAESLLTEGELVFYRALLSAVGDEFAIFAKVRVVDVLEPPNGAGRQNFLGRMAQRHFDIVLATRTDLRPVVAIELDDRSHSSSRQAARDRELDEACERAGLPLARIRAARGYSPSEIRKALLEAAVGTHAGT